MDLPSGASVTMSAPVVRQSDPVVRQSDPVVRQSDPGPRNTSVERVESPPPMTKRTVDHPTVDRQKDQLTDAEAKVQVTHIPWKSLGRCPMGKLFRHKS